MDYQEIKENDYNKESAKRIKIDWGRQGGAILAYVVVLFTYYGIIANVVMINQYGHWISYLDMNRTILFWAFDAYAESFFLPPLILFFTCFFLTYKEDIPHYGIKASLWLVPSLLIEASIFYVIMFGVSVEPFIWQFTNWKGYMHILILIAITLSGAFTGAKLRQFILKKRKVLT